MKRFIIVVACALLMLPPSSAYAGTWSWHSDLMQMLFEKFQQNQGGRKAEKPVAPAKPLIPQQVPKR